MNILHYLEMRGDLTFAERPFNEVDNLIFASLAYLDMKDIVPEDFVFDVSLKKLCKRYLQLGYDQSYVINDPKILLKKIVSCKRFERVRVGGYFHYVSQDDQVQFSCATFMLGDGTAYVGFCGTDDTLAGWREDFNFTFMSSTPGQDEAVAYIDRLCSCTACPLRLGGHSKGGNFAMYGAAFCDEHMRDTRIIEICSNDGPGFRKNVTDSEQYKAILDRTLKLIPDSSIVGIMLSGKEKTKVVRSTAKGISQHGFYTWRVRCDHFEEVGRISASSAFLDETVRLWLDSLEDEQKEAVVSAVFDAIEASGATTLTELNANKWVSYNAILKAASQIDPDVQSDILNSLVKLAGAGKDALWNEAKKAFERFDPSKAIAEE